MMTSCPEGLFSYTIQSGDTLWLISRRHYTTVEAIMAANPGINPGNLQVGQMICIPSGNRTSQPQTQPAQPTQPTQPAQPTQPVQPTQPAQPTQPTQPAQTTQPGMQPNQPSQPQTTPVNTSQMSTNPLRSEAVSGSTTRCPVGLRAYTIQKGDTLWLLAKKYCTNVEAIMALNPGIKPGNLMIGQVIWIPAGYKFRNLPPWAQSMDNTMQQRTVTVYPVCPQGSRSYTIEAGDTLWLLSQRYNTTVEAIMAANPGVNPTNLFVGQVICIPRNRPQPSPQPQPSPEPQLPTYMWVSKAEQNLGNYLRFLWLQQVYWLRMAIQSELWNLSDAEYVMNRLLENPQDFQMALKTFYGDENAKKFADLLTNHLTLISHYVMAIRDGNAQAAADAENQLNNNGVQMVSFLTSINPNWTASDLQRMLSEYMNLTKEEIDATMSQNFENSINIFADIERGALEMADMMTKGIVKQYPQYFR